jgi:hypothetical protein
MVFAVLLWMGNKRSLKQDMLITPGKSQHPTFSNFSKINFQEFYCKEQNVHSKYNNGK